jgi:hypothetical protein
MDIITEIDLVAAREQLQELDARKPVEGDGDSQDLNVRFTFTLFWVYTVNEELTGDYTYTGPCGWRECRWCMRHCLRARSSLVEFPTSLNICVIFRLLSQ